MLKVENLTIKYGDFTVAEDISFSVKSGDWLMLAGPNGAGKSTVINAISGGTKYTGTVLLDGKDIKSMKPVEIARTMGVLSQQHYVSYAYTIEEVVSLGCYSRKKGFLSGSDKTDTARIEDALKMVGLWDIRHQSMLSLSGGELQRAFLAQLFAQNPKLLILDEPTNHLDLVYQKQVFNLVSEWIEKTGCAVISVVHDLSLVKTYGKQTLLMNKGKTIAYGDTKEVLSREKLNDVYNMDVYDWMQGLLGQWA